MTTALGCVAWILFFAGFAWEFVARPLYEVLRDVWSSRSRAATRP